MNKGSIEAAKKFFGKHFMNQFGKVDSYEKLPKVFRRNLFGTERGKDMFYLYQKKGQFYTVLTPESKYLVHIGPEEITIADDSDSLKKLSDIEFELNLPILGLTLKELLEGIFQEKEKPEEEGLSESDIKRLVKKIVKEQQVKKGL